MILAEKSSFWPYYGHFIDVIIDFKVFDMQILTHFNTQILTHSTIIALWAVILWFEKRGDLWKIRAVSSKVWQKFIFLHWLIVLIAQFVRAFARKTIDLKFESPFSHFLWTRGFKVSDHPVEINGFELYQWSSWNTSKGILKYI